MQEFKQNIFSTAQDIVIVIIFDPVTWHSLGFYRFPRKNPIKVVTHPDIKISREFKHIETRA